MPLLIRMTTGTARPLATQHSHSLESCYATHSQAQGAHTSDVERRSIHALASSVRPRSGPDLRTRRLVNVEDEISVKLTATLDRPGPPIGQRRRPDHLWRFAPKAVEAAPAWPRRG